MRKPVYAICEQQRYRSACASAQSDQHLCCSLLGQYNTSTCYSRNFKTLTSLISRAGRFESYLVGIPDDRFSRDVAHCIHVCVIGFSMWGKREMFALLFRYFVNVYNVCHCPFSLPIGDVGRLPVEPRHEKTCLCHMRTTKVQISLCIHAV